MSESKSIDDLRMALFQTIQQVREGTIDLDKARAVNELGKTLIDSAKVEVEYLRIAGGDKSSFLEPSQPGDKLPDGITGTTVHRLR